MKKRLKDFYNKYLIHFPDFLQYIILLVLGTIAWIFFW